MSYPFDVEKALQAINVVMQRETEQTGERSMDYVRLLKFLYIADRESLHETGSPITGDEAYAMDHGPILTQIYEAMWERGQHPQWKHFIVREGSNVSLRKNPGKLKLSRYDVDKLVDVTRRFQNVPNRKVIDHTHTYPEWNEFYVPDTSTHIPLESILKAVGHNQKAVERILEESESISFAKQTSE